MSEITMGEATRAAQGYPTQVWAPINPKVEARDAVALMHDRTGKSVQPGIFFMPGNRIGKLFTPGAEVYTLELPGGVRRLRLPDSVLWSNHGGPCERRGAQYSRVREEVMRAAYRACLLDELPIVIPGRYLGTSQDYKGPFDYILPAAPPMPGERPRLQLMSTDLLRALGDRAANE